MRILVLLRLEVKNQNFGIADHLLDGVREVLSKLICQLLGSVEWNLGLIVRVLCRHLRRESLGVSWGELVLLNTNLVSSHTAGEQRLIDGVNFVERLVLEHF